MAIWQFKISLVPRDGVQRVHGVITSTLDEFTSPSGESVDFLDEEYPNYWEGVKIPPDCLRELESLLPPIESWSDRARMFGYDSGHKLEVWDTEVRVSFDMRAFDPDYFRHVLDLARRMECLVVLNGSGAILSPDDEEVLEACNKSVACRFVADPESTLLGLRRKKSSGSE